MKLLSFAISLIGTGLIIGFGLIVYAHANFATKETLSSVEKNQFAHQNLIREDIKEIKNHIRDIRNALIKP